MRRTLRAEMMCSGSIVFFESFSQISFASEAIARTNSGQRARTLSWKFERTCAWGNGQTFAALGHEIFSVLCASESGRKKLCKQIE
jgi:hypothetical protein